MYTLVYLLMAALAFCCSVGAPQLQEQGLLSSRGTRLSLRWRLGLGSTGPRLLGSQ